MPTQAGLPRPELEALVKRFLDGEPGVTVQDLGNGLGFLCGPALGTVGAPRRLFAVATDGGVLLRLDRATCDKLVENGMGEANVALPEWVASVPSAGRPGDWVWVPVPDGAAFERRRPHIHEALAYGRHRLEAPGA